MKNKNIPALFLDRDGVINQRIIGGYILDKSQFTFMPGVLEALRILSDCFSRIFIVTNQQCIGKGLLSEEGLDQLHQYMLKEISRAGGRIDRVYYSPYLDGINHPMRKPNIGMALKALTDFPEIDLSRSVMVGDSIHDLEFGRTAGMLTVFIRTDPELDPGSLADLSYTDLPTFARSYVQA